VVDDLSQLKAECRRLARGVRLLVATNLALAGVLAVLLLGGFAHSNALGGAADSLRVRELVVVDSNGLARVRIGAT
jgi:FlaG/FlaF family flagellin (archaellin)